MNSKLVRNAAAVLAVAACSPSLSYAAPANTAAAAYNPSTGELFVDVGTNVHTIEFTTASLFDVTTSPSITGLIRPAQLDDDVVAWFSITGLPVGTFVAGPYLDAALSIGDIIYGFTAIGGPSFEGSVGPIPPIHPLPDNTAAADYDAVSGDLLLALGKNIGVIGFESIGHVRTTTETQWIGTLVAKLSADNLTISNGGGLPDGLFNLGAVLPTGLTSAQISFQYGSRAGSGIVAAPVAVIPEPASGVLALAGMVAGGVSCRRRP